MEQTYNVVMTVVEERADQPIVVFEATMAQCTEMIHKIMDKKWVVTGNKAYNVAYIRHLEVLTDAEVEEKYGNEDEDESAGTSGESEIA